MSEFLQSLDPTLVLVVVAPLLLTAAAWTLRMACAACAVETPSFWHAMLTLVILLVANVVLRFFLFVTRTPPTMTTEYLAPLLANATVIGLSLPTAPLSAILIAVVHVVFTALIYLGTAMAITTLYM